MARLRTHNRRARRDQRERREVNSTRRTLHRLVRTLPPASAAMHRMAQALLEFGRLMQPHVQRFVDDMARLRAGTPPTPGNSTIGAARGPTQQP